MPQIFHRSFNVISKASIFGAIFFLFAIGWVVGKTVRSPYSTNAYVALQQPVPFSHEHHVGGLGIDCRYCHSTVEHSRFAGMPATKTCMNCHSQIWVNSPMLAPVRESYATGKPIAWNRVHRLADFAYFDHSIHVQKGVGCSTCHGRVDRMPLVWQVQRLHMEWCLECHRNPKRYVRPREEVFTMDWEPGSRQLEIGQQLVDEYGIQRVTHCSACHR